MKYSSILLIALFAFFTSCTSENDTLIEETLIDFSGIYEGQLNCTGEMSSDVGESITIIITKTSKEDSYSIDLGDEVVFNATQIDNVLNIEAQTLNEEQEFDVISMVGEIRMVDEEMMFDFTHSVDDEGESSCSFPLTKK